MKFSKRIYRAFAILVLMITVIFNHFSIDVYAYDMPLGEKNTSNKIYEWVRVRSVEDIMDIIGDEEYARKKEFRLLMMPAVSHGKNKVPTFENYSIVDDGEDDLGHVSLKDNQWIAYDSDVFYTRGGMRAPYLVYKGMAGAEIDIRNAGEAVPTCRLYEADKNDQKTSELLIGKQYVFAEAQVVWTESDLKSLSEGYFDDTWALCFPAANYDTKVAKHLGNTVYRKECEGLVAFGCVIPNVKSKEYSWIADDLNDAVDDYCLQDGDSIDEFDDVSEIFYKCYIGTAIDTLETVDGTVTVNNGQKNSLSGVSYIKRNSVIDVKEGGTLFISGTCINNGIIKSSGGTIIVQKGAVITTMDTWGTTSGNIVITDGELIIREGARIMNQNDDSSSNDECTILINGSGHVINKGIICVLGNFRMTDTAEVENEGCIYTGYEFSNVRKALVGYNNNLFDKTADEYADEVTKELKNNLKMKYDRSFWIIGRRGVFRNEGINY